MPRLLWLKWNDSLSSNDISEESVGPTIDEREEFPNCHFHFSPNPISKPGFLSHPFLTNLCPYSKMSTYCRMHFSNIHSISRCIILVILSFIRQDALRDAVWLNLTLGCKMAKAKFLLNQLVHCMWCLLTPHTIISILLLSQLIITLRYNSGEDGRKKGEENNLQNFFLSYFT
jgi:hypothetical protein